MRRKRALLCGIALLALAALLAPTLALSASLGRNSIWLCREKSRSGWRGFFLQGDRVAEPFELGDDAFADAFGVAAGEEVAAGGRCRSRAALSM
jgi:hypothetical protein